MTDRQIGKIFKIRTNETARPTGSKFRQPAIRENLLDGFAPQTLLSRGRTPGRGSRYRPTTVHTGVRTSSVRAITPKKPTDMGTQGNVLVGDRTVEERRHVREGSATRVRAPVVRQPGHLLVVGLYVAK